jgi:AraC-like DNA-binding protein
MAHLQHSVALAPANEPRKTGVGGLSPQRERQVKQLILERLGESLEVTELARACSLSRSHFSRAFKCSTGLSPQDWIRTLGKERIAKVHLKDFQNRSSKLEWVNLWDGDLNWAEIHKAFAEIGYNGYVTVELRGGDEKYLRDVSGRVDKILNG